MHVHVRGAALMPCGEQDTTVAAVVLNILERVHHVWDKAKAESEAEGEAGPDTVQHWVSTYPRNQ
jgi:hypothetical protein